VKSADPFELQHRERPRRTTRPDTLVRPPSPATMRRSSAHA
jgi:hypothetical protein